MSVHDIWGKEQDRYQPGVLADPSLLGAEGVERPNIEDIEGFFAGATGAGVSCLRKQAAR